MQQKVRFFAQERLVVPDLSNLQDFIEEEFYLYNTKLFTSTTKIVGGFIPSVVSALNISVSLTNAKVFHSSGTYKAFYVADSTASPLTYALTANSTNYVHIQISKLTGSAALRAFWDRTANNNVGGEIEQEVDTVDFLDVSLYVSTSGFSVDPDKIPIAEIPCGPASVTSIKDRRNLFFRLGTGYPYLPSYDKTLTATTDIETNFTNGDKELTTFKDWQDYVMTKFKKIQGTSSWYSDPPMNLQGLTRKMTGGGTWSWDVLESPPALIVDLSAFTVLAGSQISSIDPAVLFSNDGTVGGTFEINTDPAVAGLAVGQMIVISKSDGTRVNLSLKTISGSSPWTLTCKTTLDLTNFLSTGPIASITSVTPNINFSLSGDTIGTFQILSDPIAAGLSKGQTIVINNNAVLNPRTRKLVIKDIIGSSPWTIKCETAYLTFSEDAEFVILGTANTNTIKFTTQSPINLGYNLINGMGDVAYVDIVPSASLPLNVYTVGAEQYVDNANRVIIARRVGLDVFSDVYVGS